jgi:hypothetical protein
MTNIFIGKKIQFIIQIITLSSKCSFLTIKINIYLKKTIKIIEEKLNYFSKIFFFVCYMSKILSYLII